MRVQFFRRFAENVNRDAGQLPQLAVGENRLRVLVYHAWEAVPSAVQPERRRLCRFFIRLFGFHLFTFLPSDDLFHLPCARIDHHADCGGFRVPPLDFRGQHEKAAVVIEVLLDFVQFVSVSFLKLKNDDKRRSHPAPNRSSVHLPPPPLMRLHLQLAVLPRVAVVPRLVPPAAAKQVLRPVLRADKVPSFRVQVADHVVGVVRVDFVSDPGHHAPRAPVIYSLHVHHHGFFALVPDPDDRPQVAECRALPDFRVHELPWV
mmetsp:Transcript_16260/g.40112  ORF Transcript_16260/g.40112 Transcript_16260/m.40112 type:complete len:261 (+) Transcript_16260:5274-6056(+)